jgi:predicted Co/Zn/Cd cation transporter (cation efflux family)
MDGAVRKISLVDTVKTVLAGAIGVRRRFDHERAPLNPLHLVIAGVILALLFVFTLLTIVKLVLS